MKPDLQRAYAGQSYCRKLTVCIASELNYLDYPFTILHPYLRKRKRLVFIELLHSWIAHLDSRSSFFTLEIVEELLISFIHTLKTILKYLTMDMFEDRIHLLPLGQHVLLVIIGDRFPKCLICLLALNYGVIVKSAQCTEPVL